MVQGLAEASSSMESLIGIVYYYSLGMLANYIFTYSIGLWLKFRNHKLETTTMPAFHWYVETFELN